MKFLLLSLVVMLSACTAMQEEHGRPITLPASANLRHLMMAQEVQTILGQPHERASLPNGYERWRYYHETRYQTNTVAANGFVHADQRHERWEATLLFHRGKLVEVE